MATPKKKTSAKKNSARSEEAEEKLNGTASRNPADETPASPAPAGSDAGEDAGEEGADGHLHAHRKHTPAIFKLPKKSVPVVFTIDDVREVLKNRREEAREEAEKKEAAARKAARAAQVVEEEQKQRVLGAATLADILGFNPVAAAQPKAVVVDEKEIPSKYRKYYRELLDLRRHVLNGLNDHSRDTLKTSPRDEAGDIADSDSNTDGFDRDFALSLVANEQEALSEIAAAIQRMQDGSYGICEITGKAIAPERLEAVPFTRYSLEGQAEFERQNRRRAQRASAYIDSSDDVGTFSSEDGDE